MKNIYEDGREFSMENENAHSFPAREEERRQHRSAEEKREKRNERLERAATRRADKESQQAQNSSVSSAYTPMYSSYPGDPVSMAAPYNVQQSYGQPPQITPPAINNVGSPYPPVYAAYIPVPGYVPYPPQGYMPYGQAFPVQQNYAPYGQPPQASQPPVDTSGMKIVYQSPDFYNNNAGGSPRIPVIVPGTASETKQPAQPVQPQAQAQPQPQTQRTGYTVDSVSEKSGSIPRRKPHSDEKDSSFRIETPPYSGGRAFEDEMKKTGRYAYTPRSGFSVSSVSSDELFESLSDKNYEELTIADKTGDSEAHTSLRKRKGRSEKAPQTGKQKENSENKIKPVNLIPDDFDDEEDEKPVKKAPKEKKETSAAEKTRITVLIISLAVALGSLVYLGYEFKLRLDNKKLEQEFSASAQINEVETTKKKKNNKTTTNPVEETTLSEEENFAKLRAEHPEIMYPVGLQAKYAPYYTENQDFVGYISINGLGISLPVVQADNDEEYLKKNFYGQSTKYGCPFAIHMNNIDLMDKNTVIYGHYMHDGSIFAPLHEYKSIDGYKSAPVITFNTLYKDYKWKIFAVIITNTYAKDDNDYFFRYYFTNLSSDENFKDYLDALKARTLYTTGVDVLPTDKLLTLSTCTYEFSDARLVVVARMVRPGESAEVDTSLASVNGNPRYPQAYYDKKNKKNPFDTTYNWYPEN
ncbi:MAG: class B sortase [Clostridia bacterium]|nr:class B sortase [Clostridia bacterium]